MWLSVWTVIKDIGTWVACLIQAGVTFGLAIGPLFLAAGKLTSDLFLLPVRLVVAVYRLVAQPYHKTPEQLAGILSFDLFGKWRFAAPDVSRVFQVLHPDGLNKEHSTSLAAFRETWEKSIEVGKENLLKSYAKKIRCSKCHGNFICISNVEVPTFKVLETNTHASVKFLTQCPNCSNPLSKDGIQYVAVADSGKIDSDKVDLNVIKTQVENVDGVPRGIDVELSVFLLCQTPHGVVSLELPCNVHSVQPISRTEKKWTLTHGRPGELCPNPNTETPIKLIDLSEGGDARSIDVTPYSLVTLCSTSQLNEFSTNRTLLLFTGDKKKNYAINPLTHLMGKHVFPVIQGYASEKSVTICWSYLKGASDTQGVSLLRDGVVIKKKKAYGVISEYIRVGLELLSETQH